jgi:hypothetical protein
MTARLLPPFAPGSVAPTAEAAAELIVTLANGFGPNVGAILILATPEPDGDGFDVKFATAHLCPHKIIDILDDIADRLAQEAGGVISGDAPAGRAQ